MDITLVLVFMGITVSFIMQVMCAIAEYKSDKMVFEKYKTPKLNKILKPQKCTCCGATLKNNTCEYCGTIYK